MTWINGEWTDDMYAGIVTRWCPECDPNANLTQPWEMVYCEPHKPLSSGKLDHVVDTSVYLNGTAEAGGSESAALANLLHRGIST